jgi:hypothetical protein
MDINRMVEETQHATSYSGKMKREVIQAIQHIIELFKEQKHLRPTVVSDLPRKKLQPMARTLLAAARSCGSGSGSQLGQGIMDELTKLSDEQRKKVINVHDNLGGSALFYAVLHQNAGLVYQLLQLGARSLEPSPMYNAPILTYALTVLATMELNNKTADAASNQSIIIGFLLNSALATLEQDEIKHLELIKHILGLAELARSEAISVWLVKSALEIATAIQRMRGRLPQAEELDLAGMLHRAIKAPDDEYRHELVKALLESPWGKAIINSPDAHGHTPLYYAKALSNASLIWLLVFSGAVDAFSADVPENGVQAAVQQLRTNRFHTMEFFTIANPCLNKII